MRQIRDISCPFQSNVISSVINGKDYHITRFDVFDGIEFIFNDIHTAKVQIQKEKDPNILEISYCLEGRLENHILEDHWYISAGDVSIVKANQMADELYCPLGHFHGITIRIDLKKAPDCLSCFLNGLKLRPQDLATRFCKEGVGYVIHDDPAFGRIFSELYHIPEEIQSPYFKLKTLEILLYLSGLKVKTKIQTYTKNQVLLAQKISSYILENMDVHLTLADLSSRFNVSEVYIKKVFKGVYGVSIGGYVRHKKMESAALMLEKTNRSILEIANEHGYANASKFASAFRNVKKMNPTQYRERWQ